MFESAAINIPDDAVKFEIEFSNAIFESVSVIASTSKKPLINAIKYIPESPNLILNTCVKKIIAINNNPKVIEGFNVNGDCPSNFPTCFVLFLNIKYTEIIIPTNPINDTNNTDVTRDGFTIITSSIILKNIIEQASTIPIARGFDKFFNLFESIEKDVAVAVDDIKPPKTPVNNKPLFVPRIFINIYPT